MLDYDYSEKTKKKKKHSKEDKTDKILGIHKAKPVRNFKIIDDDIDLSSLKANEEAEAMVDLLGPDAPIIVNDYEVIEKTKVVNKVDVAVANKWIKVDLCQDEDGEFSVKTENDDNSISDSKGLFKKRGEKSMHKVVTDDENDSDLDSVPRRRSNNTIQQDNDGDLSPIRRKSTKTEKIEEVNENKVRVRKPTKDEELKKAKKEEKMAKYMEWGKGIAQKREREEKLKNDLHEADKPLARYKSDKDLEKILKEQEREDDPMLEYIRKNRQNENGEVDSAKSLKKAVYKGPPAPPNRYNIMPGSRWDGLDRSNGFEKKFYESINSKKAREEEAYKWSIEDM